MRNAEHLDEAILVDCSAASSEAPAEEQVLANGEVRKEPVGLEDDLKTRPLTLIVPDAGFTRPAMPPASVDLPQPDGPSTAVKPSPGRSHSASSVKPGRRVVK